MGIKETPTNFRTYYKTMRDSIRPKYEEAIDKYEKDILEVKALHSELMQFAKEYKSKYKFDFTKYPELMNNTYIDGKFYNDAKGLFINKKDNYTATTSLYKLYNFARKQKNLYELQHQIHILEQMLDITLNQYKDILEAFYNEVHKKLIIDGYGYVLENPMGWICINRCKIVQGRRKMLDFQATKANKARLLAEGKRLWNKEEAMYAASVGIEYKGVDYRVYKDNEVCYEIPLINCRVLKGEKIKFEPTARRRYTIGKTDNSMIADCNYDLNKICELPLDIPRKLKLCIKTNDILYLNFIRNESQQSVKTPKANRKNR